MGCLRATSRQLTTTAPASVGVFAYQEHDSAMAVDLVNYHLDLATDRITPAKDVQLVLRPPAGKRFAGTQGTLISPDERTPAPTPKAVRPLTPWSYRRVPVAGHFGADGTLALTLPEFAVFCTLSVPIKD